MDSITQTSVFVAAREHLSAELDNEAVLLHVQRGVYYGLNSVGNSVWKLLQQPKSFAEVCDAVVAEYDVDRATCEKDVRALLERMVQTGIVETVDAQLRPARNRQH